MNRRKIILLSAPAVLLLCVVFLGYKIWSTAQAKEKIKTTIQNLPSIQLCKTDGSILHVLKTFCDHIYVLDKGFILTAGNHEALLLSDNLYSRYWADMEG